MTNILEQFEDFKHTINRHVTDLPRVQAGKVGLDWRVGSLRIDYDANGVFIPLSQRRTADYYGGLEYVNSEHVTVMGDWVFYSADAPRIEEIMPDQDELGDDE